mmetsp:Transcript_5313/g.20714  ORF Transcript_5313/g.20714 Transcript_5313/m.20714 type:complete len:201 (+) Transcript_5313:246-848(+)
MRDAHARECQGGERETEVYGDGGERGVAFGERRRGDEEAQRGAERAGALRRASHRFHPHVFVVNEVVRDDTDAESEDALKNVRREREGWEVGQIDALRLVKVRRQPTQKAVHAPALRELRDANRAHFLATYELRPNRERRRRLRRRGARFRDESSRLRVFDFIVVAARLAMVRKCEPKRCPQQRDRAKAIKRTRPSELAH